MKCYCCNQTLWENAYFSIIRVDSLYFESEIASICSKCFSEVSDEALQDSCVDQNFEKAINCPYCKKDTEPNQPYYYFSGYDEEGLYRKSKCIDPACFSYHVGIESPKIPISGVQGVGSYGTTLGGYNYTFTLPSLQQAYESIVQASTQAQTMIVSPKILKQIDKVFEKANKK
jgi:hypothetical protein